HRKLPLPQTNDHRKPLIEPTPPPAPNDLHTHERHLTPLDRPRLATQTTRQQLPLPHHPIIRPPNETTHFKPHAPPPEKKNTTAATGLFHAGRCEGGQVEIFFCPSSLHHESKLQAKKNTTCRRSRPA